MCKERKLNLINHTRKIKPNHLNRGKLHLNQKGSKVLGDDFLKKYLMFLIDIIVTKIQD